MATDFALVAPFDDQYHHKEIKMSEKSGSAKLIGAVNHWAPPVVCTFLSYYLGKGAFDGVGMTVDATWSSIMEWAADPISFPRWFVLSGTTGVFAGGAFLWLKQYQRIKALTDTLQSRR